MPPPPSIHNLLAGKLQLISPFFSFLLPILSFPLSPLYLFSFPFLPSLLFFYWGGGGGRGRQVLPPPRSPSSLFSFLLPLLFFPFSPLSLLFLLSLSFFFFFFFFWGGGGGPRHARPPPWIRDYNTKQSMHSIHNPCMTASML